MPSVPAKRVAILQSCYIPWKGYFDLINSVDEFILYDDVQYTVRDWRNRNRIKTPQGLQWLTIPVHVETRRQSIRDTRVADSDWRRRHWLAWQRNYARAPWFRSYAPVLEPLYLDSAEPSLSRINAAFIEALCGVLGIRTRLTWSADYRLVDGRSERLVDLCRQAGATEYLSGPAARAYLRPELFAEAGIAVRWMSYEGYPEYPQLHGAFDHYVSVLDLLFQTGPAAPRFMLSFGDAVSGAAGTPGEPPHV